MDIHAEAYREEAYELLAELESSLLELEENSSDMDLVGRVFRAMHTIKGSGAMFGFDNIATFTHNVETVYDMVREGKIPVTGDLVGLTLSACDQIKKMVDGDPDCNEGTDSIAEGFRMLIPAEGNAVYEGDGEDASKEEEALHEDLTYRIRFRPPLNIFATGQNPVVLLDELRDLGECRIAAQENDIPSLEDIDPEAFYIYWDIVLTTYEGEDAIRDVFIFVEDESEIDISVIDEEGIDGEEEYRKLGQILIDRDDLSAEELNRALEGQKRIGEVLVESELVDKGAVKSALEEQEHVKEVRDKRKKATQASSVRVASDKLDILVDLVGELVTVQARLSQYSVSKEDNDVLSIAEEVERLTVELRDNTMSIRMLPIGTTFSKFKRLVRDLSNDLGKEVNLSTEGGETELDKTVIERLNDPMVHIIRNCIDHGIESPEERENSGKPRQGTVNLSAMHSGGSVLIRISDDGAGLDLDTIRSKAVERGVISPDAELSDKDIFSLIFEAGFSTAEAVTGVSGRGVGMDVVKRSIEELRGFIDINSEKGEGTTITLKLPLTLAIIDGLLVDIGQDYYVMPLSAVEECVEMNRDDAVIARERHMMSFRGNVVPYLSLRDMFGIDEDRPDIEQVVIAETNGELVGLGVDRLIGQNQTVIKTLSNVYKNVEGLSGATILGDGTVALILDVAQLVQSAECI